MSVLGDLLNRRGVALAEVAACVDALDPAQRILECRSLGSPQQERVWHLAETAPPLTLDMLVPPACAGQTVAFAGRNTLPSPFAFFEKRFFRSGDQVIGYNAHRLAWLTGPGYFTVESGPAISDDFTVESGPAISGDSGSLRFDYTRLPASAPAADWPAVQSNSRGMSRFVYAGLHDVCRRVTSDVVIGAAMRHGKPLNSYFILARR